MSAFGQEYQLNVTLNDVLFSPHFEMEVRGNGSSEFQHDIEHCHYLGQLLHTEGKRSKVAVSNCDGLVRKFIGTGMGKADGPDKWKETIVFKIFLLIF